MRITQEIKLKMVEEHLLSKRKIFTPIKKPLKTIKKDSN